MTRLLKLGLMLACLTALSACSARPCPPPRAAQPPVVYLQHVEEPTLAGQTNGDLAQWALDLRAALRLANSDKKALREWAEGGGALD